MNCKQGDLAIYVGGPVMAVEEETGDRLVVVPCGMICRCVSIDVVGGKLGWNIDPRDVSLQWPSGKTYSATITGISDDCLRPVLGDDTQLDATYQQYRLNSLVDVS